MWLFPKWLPVHPALLVSHAHGLLADGLLLRTANQSAQSELILSLREEIYNEDFAAINWPV